MLDLLAESVGACPRNWWSASTTWAATCPRSRVSQFSVFDVSRRLREFGWLVPAYTFPANREDLAVLRVVCRSGFSLDLADRLVDDLGKLLP